MKYICRDIYLLISSFLYDLDIVRRFDLLCKESNSIIDQCNIKHLKILVNHWENERFLVSCAIGYFDGVKQYIGISSHEQNINDCLELSMQHKHKEIQIYLMFRCYPSSKLMKSACNYQCYDIAEYLYKNSKNPDNKCVIKCMYELSSVNHPLFRVIYQDMHYKIKEHMKKCLYITKYHNREAGEWIYLTYLKHLNIADILDYDFNDNNMNIIRLVDKYGVLNTDVSHGESLLLQCSATLEDRKFVYERYNLNVSNMDIYSSTLEYLAIEEIKWLDSIGMIIVNEYTMHLRWLPEHINETVNLHDIVWILDKFHECKSVFCLGKSITFAQLYNRLDILELLF